jgi:hypothetical protein
LPAFSEPGIDAPIEIGVLTAPVLELACGAEAFTDRELPWPATRSSTGIGPLGFELQPTNAVNVKQKTTVNT